MTDDCQTALRVSKRARAIPIDKHSIGEMAKLLEQALAQRIRGKRGPLGKSIIVRGHPYPIRAVDGSMITTYLRLESIPTKDFKYIPSGGLGFSQGKPVVVAYVNGSIDAEQIYKGAKSHLVQRQLYPVLIHELTHAADKFSRGVGESLTQEEAQNNAAYYNHPTEVRAYLQEVVDETSQFFKHYGTLQRAFGNRALEMLLKRSDTWEEVSPHWTERNKRKVIKAVVQALDAWQSRQKVARSAGPQPTSKSDVLFMPLSEDKFVHFTTRERASKILADGKLRMRPPYAKFGTDTVDAVSTVWGAFVPGTQTRHLQKYADAEGGMVAVLFMTNTMPHVGFIEEVKWHQDVNLRRAVVISADKAKSLLARTPHQLEDDMTTVVYQNSDRTASETALARRVSLRYVRAGNQAFDQKAVDKLRKDFLVLVKNVPHVVQRMKEDYNFEVYDEFRGVVRDYNKTLRDLLEGLKKSLDYDPSFSDSTSDSIKRSLAPAWAFSGELSNLPRKPSSFRDVEAWDKRVRRKARDFWKAAKTTLEWLRRPEGLTVQTPDRLVLEGFQAELVGFDPSDDYLALESLREALRIYRRKASKALPWLLQHQLPLTIGFQEGTDLGGRYRGKDILINAYANLRNPKGTTKTLAHEMGHHLFKHLSGKAEVFWNTAIRQDYGPLDLREVVAKWPSGKYANDFFDFWALKDPILALQVDVLSWGHHQREYKTKNDYEEAIAEGRTEEAVPKSPITGYAGTNPEESFCEAVGLLVAYGPRAVHEKIRHYLGIVIPGKIKLASLEERVASRYSVYGRECEST